MEAKMQQLANVIDHLVRHEAFRIGPVVITTTVVNTWIIMAVLFAAVYLLTRRLDEKPKGAQALLEVIIEFYYSLIDTGMGKAGRKYLPIVGSLFTFITCSTSPGSFPNMVPPTTDLMTTAALGITTLAVVHMMGIRERGLGGYLRHYAEPTPILLPMNLLEEVVRAVFARRPSFRQHVRRKDGGDHPLYPGPAVRTDACHGPGHPHGIHSGVYLYPAQRHLPRVGDPRSLTPPRAGCLPGPGFAPCDESGILDINWKAVAGAEGRDHRTCDLLAVGLADYAPGHRLGHQPGLGHVDGDERHVPAA